MSNVYKTSSGIHYALCDVVPEWVRSPQTLIFHHGIGANLHIFARWLPILALHYRLVRFDMRGFGSSVIPPRDHRWDFEQLVADTLTVADAVGATRFHLIGESIGGTSALACALHAPDRVQSLCLSNAAARGGLVSNVKGWREIVAQSGQRAWADQMMQWRFHPDAIPAALHDWFHHVHATCSMDATYGLADLLLNSDLTPRLKDVKIPVLLLAPEASPFIPLEVMASMRSALPDAELQVFAHSKHGLPLSHGEQCAAVLRAFLQRRFSAEAAKNA